MRLLKTLPSPCCVWLARSVINASTGHSSELTDSRHHLPMNPAAPPSQADEAEAFAEQQLLRKLLAEPLPQAATSTPRGMANLGSTCYLNSMVQGLCNVAAFPQLLWFLCNAARREEALSGKLRAKHQLLEALLLTHQQLQQSSGGQSALTPSALVAAAVRAVSGLRHRRQEDAHELLLGVLAACADVADAAGTGPCSIFRGRMVSRIVCSACNGVSDTFQDVEALSLDIAGHATLDEALKAHFGAEQLTGSSAYACAACADKVSAKKQLGLAAAPEALAIHLLRFAHASTPAASAAAPPSLQAWMKGAAAAHHQRITKAGGGLSFPLSLSLSHLVLRKEVHDTALHSHPLAGPHPSKRPLYTLRALVVHKGPSPRCGHYTAFLRKGKQWWEADDGAVRKVDAETALAQPAYVLLYERVQVTPKGMHLSAAKAFAAAAAEASPAPAGVSAAASGACDGGPTTPAPGGTVQGADIGGSKRARDGADAAALPPSSKR